MHYETSRQAHSCINSPTTPAAALPFVHGPPTLPTTMRERITAVPSNVPAWPCFPKDESRRNLSRKPNVYDLRNAREVGAFQNGGLSPRRLQAHSDHTKRTSIKRSRLEKPLPGIPTNIQRAALTSNPRYGDLKLEEHSRSSLLLGHHGRTEDATYYQGWSPAATHQTITRSVNEIHEERVHKEIHKYHMYHRVQPIVDYEILPARHFVPFEDGYMEISEADLPSSIPNDHWVTREVTRTLKPAIMGSRLDDSLTNVVYRVRTDDLED